MCVRYVCFFGSHSPLEIPQSITSMECRSFNNYLFRNMRKLISIAFALMSITRLIYAQSGSVSINPDYSDWGATANVSGTYVDQSPGSCAMVTNVSAQVVHARISWPSPGLTNYQPVSVQDPGGQRSSLANYYSWQTWGTETIVMISYPLQPGKTIFMV